tara:strand:- start:1892 stop:2431 length:540 start_codon:yes stop_codon:yes gene_type:complete
MTTCVIAQETWSASFRPSLHFPTRKVFNHPLRIGNGVEVTVDYSVGKQTKTYAGLIWNRFDVDQGFNEADIEYIQRGFVFGAMYFFKVLPNQKNPLYIKAGLSFMDVKARSDDATLNINTRWALGTQLGLGMKIASLERLYILPELRYGSTSNAYNSQGSQQSLSFGNVTISGGLMYIF